MAKVSKESILDSKAHILCFASSSIVTVSDLFGKKETLPMGHISPLAEALARKEPRLPGLIAIQMQKASHMYRQTRHMPFIYIRLENGRAVSPFIVRRHHYDDVDFQLVAQSASSISGFLIKQLAIGNAKTIIALERPHDAQKRYDQIISALPDSVIVYPSLKE